MGTSSMSRKSKHDWLTLPPSGSGGFPVVLAPFEASEDIQTAASRRGRFSWAGKMLASLNA